MTGFELTAALVKALAWPVAAFLIVFILRVQIKAMIDEIKSHISALRSAKGAGFEFEFGERAKEIEVTAAEVRAAEDHAEVGVTARAEMAGEGTARVDVSSGDGEVDPPTVVAQTVRTGMRSVAQANPIAAIIGVAGSVEAALREAYERAHPAKSALAWKLTSEELVQRLLRSGDIDAALADLTSQLLDLGKDAREVDDWAPAVVLADSVVSASEVAIRRLKLVAPPS